MLPETPIPSVPTVPDLRDAEFAELDDLLAQTPEPLDGLDVVMLDGFLCGVLVQPRVIPIDEWLPKVFDFDARPLPEDVDPVWRSRTVALIRRRHDALNRALVEDGLFDPLVLEFDDDDEVPPAEGDAPADAAGLDPVSQPLMPWVAGFQYATICFPDLVESADDDVALALARLYRHLPAETDEERELVETLRREQPLDTLDDAIEDLVVTVADLCELTRDQRFHVDTVRRDAPKVGRNDPCPCGSGRKFKQCHGAA